MAPSKKLRTLPVATIPHRRTSYNSKQQSPKKSNRQNTEKLKRWMINELGDVEGLLTHVAGPSPMSKAQISNFGGGGGGGKSFMALIDTGASVSLLSPVAYNRIKNTCPLITAEDAPLIDAITPTAANGAAMAVKGVTSGDVTVGGTTVPNCFILVGAEERPPPDFIIGMNIIRHMEEQQQQEKAEKSRAGSSRHNRKSGDVTGRQCRREAVKRLRRS